MKSKLSDILVCFTGVEENATFSQWSLAKNKACGSVRECLLEHITASPT